MMIRTRNPYFRLVDDLLNDSRPWLSSEARDHGLALDVEENPQAYTVRANLPGIQLDDISVNIHEDVLTIAGETAAEEPRRRYQAAHSRTPPRQVQPQPALLPPSSTAMRSKPTSRTAF